MLAPGELKAPSVAIHHDRTMMIRDKRAGSPSPYYVIRNVIATSRAQANIRLQTQNLEVHELQTDANGLVVDLATVTLVL